MAKREIVITPIPEWYPEKEDAYPGIPDPIGWNREKMGPFMRPTQRSAEFAVLHIEEVIELRLSRLRIKDARSDPNWYNTIITI